MDLWQLFGVLGVVATFVFGIGEWRRRSLSGILSLDTEVVPLGVPCSKRLSVLYDEVKLSDPYLCTITLRNTGSMQVRYLPSEAQAFRLVVTPGKHATKGLVYLLYAPGRPQIQDLQKLPLTEATNEPTWDQLEFLDDGDIVIPLREFLLDPLTSAQSESLRWTILSDGAPAVLPRGKVAGTRVLVNPPALRSDFSEMLWMFLALLLVGSGLMVQSGVIPLSPWVWVGSAALAVVIASVVWVFAIKRWRSEWFSLDRDKE